MLDLARLSAEQRGVVLAPDGPVLVVAGPGSGKTTVLAGRVAHLVLGRGVSPGRLLALAFTAAAARELRARLLAVLGDPGGAVDVATFHALGLRLVRRWASELGYGPGPLAVYAEDEARALLREAAEDVGVDPERWPPLLLQGAVARLRLAGPGPVDAAIAAVAEAYEALLKQRRAVDFPGMLALPLKLFADAPRALHAHQAAYHTVLVDEFQDLCHAQYALVRLLVAEHRRLTVVGDPMQSIFGFRGADVRFMLEFQRDFPDARVLQLSQNFRSTGRIVALANALGAPLGYRQPLWTANPPGQLAVLYAAEDEPAEARFVATEVARLRGGEALATLDEVAVLYRTNHQARELALALRARRLPYRVRGAGDFFARREVRDALGYLHLAHNPNDAAALARVINAPPRRLGRLAELLHAQPTPLDALGPLVERGGPAAAETVGAFAALVAELRAAARRLPPAPLLDLALDRTGYRVWLARQADGDERLRNLGALREAAERERDIGAWLADLQVGDHTAADGGPDGRVLLTTIHLAKGGEWPVVFLVGAEEGLLPHARALAEQPAAVDEELRLAYVAVTRPCERLYISHCRTRRLGAGVQPRRPSRFLRALPPGVLAPAA